MKKKTKERQKKKDEHKTKIRRKKDERKMKVIQNFDLIDLQVKQECIR